MATAPTQTCPPEVHIHHLNEGTKQMIVIGADTHKSTHALAAVEAGTGQVLDEREITADDNGHRQALQWAREFDADVVWALEDCRHVSHHLERALVTSGERVVRVPPKLMGVSRRGEREAGKSDQIDARSVARAVLREGIDRFPGAFLDEAAMEIRLLCDHREGHVQEITRLTNRLRWHLVILDPSLEASIPHARWTTPDSSKRSPGVYAAWSPPHGSGSPRRASGASGSSRARRHASSASCTP
ncbi:MAG: IS110 family transposase [Solirubrobacteraceae bacterium]